MYGTDLEGETFSFTLAQRESWRGTRVAGKNMKKDVALITEQASLVSTSLLRPVVVEPCLDAFTVSLRTLQHAAH